MIAAVFVLFIRSWRGDVLGKIKLIKFIDRVFGPLAAGTLPAPSRRPRPELRNVLFIRPGGIGDAVWLVPAILELKKRCPWVTVTVLAEKRNGAVFSLCPAISKVFLYDRPGDMFRVLAGRYDAVIDTEQWHRFSAVLTRLCRASITIGFATNERRRLFSHVVTYSHDTPEVESFYRLLEPLGIECQETVPPFLAVPPAQAARAGELLGEIAAAPFVTLFPGASIPERRWGAANFRVLACALRERGIPLVVVGGPGDAAEGERIVADGLGLQLAGKTSLLETAAIVARTTVLVSGDSGILHLGVGLGRATVSLFGPGIARKWAPRGLRHIVVDKGFPCSPCTRFGYTPRCPSGGACIRAITPEEVVAAVERLWRGEVG